MLALGERREAPVGPVADDRADAREISQAIVQELAGGDDVVGSSGVRASGERQAEDLDQQRALRADRPAAGGRRPASWNVGP